MGHPSIQYIWKDDPFFMSKFTDPTPEELRLLGEEFKSKFSISSLQTLANQTGMVRRNRKCQHKTSFLYVSFLVKRLVQNPWLVYVQS